MKASYVKPLLPLRDIVIFPSMVVPLFVGREKRKSSTRSYESRQIIVLITQKNSEVDDPSGRDLSIWLFKQSIATSKVTRRYR